jgi:hypothetical protein
VGGNDVDDVAKHRNWTERTPPYEILEHKLVLKLHWFKLNWHKSTSEYPKTALMSLNHYKNHEIQTG